MKRLGQTRIEWTLLAVIAVVCVVLSFLQYRLTGDLSKAEPALLRAGLTQQLRQLSQAFNNEIRESCTALAPDEREIHQFGAAVALQNRYEQWASSHAKDIFVRIGIAMPEKDRLALYASDRTGSIVPSEWTGEWDDLRKAMIARLKDSGRQPNARPESNLLEVPIFSASGSELAWMIYEINEDYIRSKVLPQLVREYLNPVGLGYDVSVTRSGSGEVLFATRTDHAGVDAGADATAGLFLSQIAGPGGRPPAQVFL